MIFGAMDVRARAENKNVKSIQALNAAIRGCFSASETKKAA